VTKRVAISSVVLSSQRIDVRNSLYNAANSKQESKNELANPLVAGGYKLVPSVTRVFNTQHPMYVYMQAYRQNSHAVTDAKTTGAGPAETAAPLFAYVTLYRDQKKSLDTGPIAVLPEPDSRLGVTPLSFHLALDKLAPGEYRCQVSVLDPAGNRAAFWQAPIMLVH
jgi:hypothetical protein